MSTASCIWYRLDCVAGHLESRDGAWDAYLDGLQESILQTDGALLSARQPLLESDPLHPGLAKLRGLPANLPDGTECSPKETLTWSSPAQRPFVTALVGGFTLQTQATERHSEDGAC